MEFQGVGRREEAEHHHCLANASLKYVCSLQKGLLAGNLWWDTWLSEVVDIWTLPVVRELKKIPQIAVPFGFTCHITTEDLSWDKLELSSPAYMVM
jgi:hypothetical protein